MIEVIRGTILKIKIGRVKRLPGTLPVSFGRVECLDYFTVGSLVVIFGRFT